MRGSNVVTFLQDLRAELKGWHEMTFKNEHLQFANERMREKDKETSPRKMVLACIPVLYKFSVLH